MKRCPLCGGDFPEDSSREFCESCCEGLERLSQSTYSAARNLGKAIVDFTAAVESIVEPVVQAIVEAFQAVGELPYRIPDELQTSIQSLSIERKTPMPIPRDQVIENATEDSQWHCQTCDEYFEDGDEEPLYECSSCGATFLRSNSADGDSHRCPDCNKFAAKMYDHACPNCEEEVDWVTVFICDTCREFFQEEDEFVDHWLSQHAPEDDPEEPPEEEG